MEILSANQLREWDQYTIKNEPITSIDLMERAASKCAKWFVDREKDYKSKHFFIFCGIGNNGGDGLVLARLLAQKGFKIQCVPVYFSSKTSADFKTNYERLQNTDVTIKKVHSAKDFPEISNKNTIIVDALLGTGIDRPSEGLVKETINYINRVNTAVIAIDVPSGLYCDAPNNSKDAIIFSSCTLSFQRPKLSFFLPPNQRFVGKLEILSIDLLPDFSSQIETSYYTISPSYVKKNIQPRDSLSHKGDFGHALLISGKSGQYGAAVLSAMALARSGVGLSSIYSTAEALPILQSAVPEAMFIVNNGSKFIEPDENYDFSNHDVIGVGPGIGTSEATEKFFGHLLKVYHQPMVVDADAINLLAKNKNWLTNLPKNSILTPHHKEFVRLFGEFDNSFERLEKQIEAAEKWKLFIVFKGQNTCLTCPDGRVYFNTTGNPGMATGGSGDVLTGLITGLLAQGYSSRDSAIIGVYIHGLAGDYAADSLGQICMKASDLINNFSKAFNEIIHLD